VTGTELSTESSLSVMAANCKCNGGCLKCSCACEVLVESMEFELAEAACACWHETFHPIVSNKLLFKGHCTREKVHVHVKHIVRRGHQAPPGSGPVQQPHSRCSETWKMISRPTDQMRTTGTAVLCTLLACQLGWVVGLGCRFLRFLASFE
jgi:hypothetical protein